MAADVRSESKASHSVQELGKWARQMAGYASSRAHLPASYCQVKDPSRVIPIALCTLSLGLPDVFPSDHGHLFSAP